MRLSSSMFRGLTPLLLLASACAGPDVAGPDDEQLTAVMPELTAEPGAAGTERYRPILHRLFAQAIRHVARAQGQEQAEKVAAEAQRRHEAVRDAVAAGDQDLAKQRVAELEHFLGTVTLRVFGPRVAGHVLQHAHRSFEAFAGKLQEAAEAGRDVARLQQGAQVAARQLEAARSAAGEGRPLAVLLHAARAADLLAHLHAAL